MGKNTLIIFFFGFNIYCQKLYSQMVSEQVTSKYISSGIIVNQTIGQVCVPKGCIKNTMIAGHGLKRDPNNKHNVSIDIKTTTYPNPILDSVNFKFSSTINGDIKVIIFDLLGKVVFHQVKKAFQNILTIDNIQLLEGAYLVQLTAENYNYSTKILKLK
jgi:hypothetical protein